MRRIWNEIFSKKNVFFRAQKELFLIFVFFSSFFPLWCFFFPFFRFFFHFSKKSPFVTVFFWLKKVFFSWLSFWMNDCCCCFENTGIVGGRWDVKSLRFFNQKNESCPYEITQKFKKGEKGKMLFNKTQQKRQQ